MEEIDGAALKSHFMGWTVKCFFLALMVVYLSGEIGSLQNAFNNYMADRGGWYQFLYDLSYMVDLLFCVVGYTITLRLFDSHIRSTEPTAFGWVIALMCYQPFYSIIGSMYLHYDDSIYWDNWLGGIGWLRNLWAAAICFLLFVYALSTVAFGLRFSNLTYRGVITSGPYRFTKHPAYLSKNLSWWLISVPWVWEPQSHWYEALRNCCLIGLLNLVYYLRARTEENHLSLRDPDYVAYALWMEEHGMMSWLGRLFPVFRYKPPAGAAAPAEPAEPAPRLKAARR
jgi:protein-S-isoprenylcysteine O-methyltransferase Ste14